MLLLFKPVIKYYCYLSLLLNVVIYACYKCYCYLCLLLDVIVI